MGSVRHEFEVAPVQPLQVTTPILTDSFQAGEAGQRRPIPVAHRTFAAGATIACAFSILGAAPDPVRSGPRVSVAYRLRRADGGDVMASPARVLSAGPLGQVTPVIFLKVPDEGALTRSTSDSRRGRHHHSRGGRAVHRRTPVGRASPFGKEATMSGWKACVLVAVLGIPADA